MFYFLMVLFCMEYDMANSTEGCINTKEHYKDIIKSSPLNRCSILNSKPLCFLRTDSAQNPMTLYCMKLSEVYA